MLTPGHSTGAREVALFFPLPQSSPSNSAVTLVRRREFGDSACAPQDEKSFGASRELWRVNGNDWVDDVGLKSSYTGRMTVYCRLGTWSLVEIGVLGT